MRENMGLYRGKRTGDGEWVEGYLTYRYRYDRQSRKEILGPVIDCPQEITLGNTTGTVIGSYKVVPGTEGQFTGFFDSTKWEELTPEEQQAFLHQPDGWENPPDVWPGKRIFEGDILEFDDVGETGYEYKEGFDFTNRAAVFWGNGRWELEMFLDTNSGVVDDMNSNYHEEFTLVFNGSKVIGNIHDNPELLEVSK